jgi:serine/threonine protein kinase
MASHSTTGYWHGDGHEPKPDVPGYELVEPLGRGGMGIVYKARRLTTGGWVALKMIRGGVLAGPEELGRFRIEAEAAMALRHPNIVAVDDFGVHQGLPYFAMELLTGGTLEERLSEGPVTFQESATWVRTLAGAVQYSHDAKVAHRDLKPANVLFGPDGLKIADFGLAKRLDGELTAWTLDGAVLGTPAYMAPEQAAGQAVAAGPAADIHALGAILYELLTGRPPFLADTRARTLELVQHAEPEPPSSWKADVPLPLETICLKCLEKDPQRRYLSAADLAVELERFLSDEPLLTQPLSDEEKLVRRARADGFELLDELGRGANAVVYRARLEGSPQVLAIKLFSPGAARNDEAQRQRWRAWFEESAAIWAAMAQPNVLVLLRHGWWGDRPYLAMDHMPAGSAAAQFANRRCPPLEAIRLVLRLAEIVTYLHRQGVMHGNLKPSNVLMAGDGVPRLTDLRLPNYLLSAKQPDVPVDPYLAPELAADPTAEPRPYTDVFGLTAILYYLLTGQPPAYDGEVPVSPSMLVPSTAWPSALTPEIDRFCTTCLRRHPWSRVLRAFDLVRWLNELLRSAQAANPSRGRSRPQS